jgi:hypothetical protein
VTVLLLVLLTVAVNVWVPPAVRLAVVGETVTEIGFNVTDAVADFVLSAEDVACTVTVVEATTTAGAVYNPDALMLPQAAPPAVQLTDQLTAVLLVALTVALNCCVAPPVRDTVAGETETEIGVSVMVADADLVVSAVKVAVTVTEVELATTAGAV